MFNLFYDTTTTTATTTTKVLIIVTLNTKLQGHFTHIINIKKVLHGSRSQLGNVQQSYDRRNRWDFVCRRKDDSDQAALICGGRLFHARAAATGNARSPKVTR